MDDKKEIQVHGYGRLTRPLIQKKIREYLGYIDDYKKDLNNKKMFRDLYQTIFGNGVLKVMMEAELREMEAEEPKE